ncbi:hypothetical protein M5D96_005598 [Drosophila gunungcola]|uniref:Odorant receptor n=1 Tax=Drosophila gunungcola TaxID=103775 RepID=A0A9P9YR21_9MUSC|nr:hypothetical protein M5D96_005598 [Drosophila gunungcola]
MCGSLMLTTVGFGNIYALIKPRNLIEKMFEELEEIYPSQSDEHYRCQHYYDLAMAIMKTEFMFYMVFYAYYNSAPILLLLWENLQEGQDPSFKTQTNTWFPWEVHGSALGFGGAILSLVLASFVGVGFSIATQNLIVIFAFQLKLHYDGLESQLLHLDSRQPNASQQLRDLIAYHSRILHIGDQFNNILNFVFWTSLVGSTIAICMMSVAILLLDAASAIKYLSGLTAFVLYHFVICYMGTEVTFANFGIITYWFLFGRKETETVSMIFSTIAICMTSVAVLLLDLGSAFKYANGLAAFSIYNFIICYLGSEVTIASDKVLSAAFYNNWYEGDLAYRKMLLILMMRASKPYMWRTYKLAPVSITTYMATLKFSYQMFTCVRSLK